MIKNKFKRQFLGNFDGPFKNSIERNFEKAHLKAYLKGKEYFNFGFHTVGAFRRRVQYKVQQELIKL